MEWRFILQVCAEMEFVNIHDLELTVLSNQIAAEIQWDRLYFICIHF